MSFPVTLDSFTNPLGSDKQDSPDHAQQHSNANDAIEAIEAKIGINSSADTNSIDYKLADTATDIAGVVADIATLTTQLSNKSYVITTTIGTVAGTADYICDGVDDDVTINQAISDVSAAGGGTILIKKGTYLVTNSVLYKSNVTLIGAGRGVTIIKQKNGGSITSAYGVVQPLGYPYVSADVLPLVSNVTITGLSIDGNAANNVGRAFECLIMIGVNKGLVHDVEVYGATETGINSNATDYFTPSTNVAMEPVIISNCFMHDCVEGCQVGPGIYVGCTAYNNSGYGFDFVSAYNIGPTSSAVCVGCTAYNNIGAGFITQFQYDKTSSRVTMSGCSSVLNGHGVNLQLHNNIVNGCLVMLNSDDGIRLHSNNDVITNNIIKNNGYGTAQSIYASYAGVQLFQDCSNVVISNNTIFDDQGTATQRYGVAKSYLLGTASQNISIYGNNFTANGSANIQADIAALPGVSIRNNTGFITENSGLGTVANGTLSVDITHGLSVTPTAEDIVIIPTNSMGSAYKYYTDNYGTAQFRINVNTNPGTATASFAWKAICL